MSEQKSMKPFNRIGGLVNTLFKLAEAKQVQIYSFERTVHEDADMTRKVFWYLNWYEPLSVPEQEHESHHHKMEHHRKHGVKAYIIDSDESDLQSFLSVVTKEIIRLADITPDEVDEYIYDNSQGTVAALGGLISSLFEIVADSKIEFKSIDRRISFTETGRKPTWSTSWFDKSAIPDFPFVNDIYGHEKRAAHQLKYGVHKFGEHAKGSDSEAFQVMLRAEISRFENQNDQPSTNETLV